MFFERNKYLRFRAGQSALEFIVLFIIVIAAFLGMKKYAQRGIQGKWKETVDGMGKQYDPGASQNMTQSIVSFSQTIMEVDGEELGGYSTLRSDITESTETKTESVVIEN